MHLKYELMIRELRIRRKMTQKELAENSGLNQSYICRLEKNPTKRSPNLSTIFKIASALDVCPHLLIRNNYNCKNNCFDNCPFL